MRKRILGVGLVCALAATSGACGGKKKVPSPDKGDAAVDPLVMPPRLDPRPRRRAVPGGAGIREVLSSPGNDDARYKALDRFVKGWPKTRAALPTVLKLLRDDATIRGGVAMSVARLGLAVAPALVAMVKGAPKDDNTLRAAGVLAYHLVSPAGLTKRSDEEREAIRKALAPLQEPLWTAFLADSRPEYEIYQGVAVGAEASVGRFRPPIVTGGLTRVAMVLYLVLTTKKDEALLPEGRRAKMRDKAAPLAALFADALAVAKADGTGESPDSLVLGLGVLGTAGAAAVARSKALQDPKRCSHVVKALMNVAEQRGAAAAMPAKGSLQRCINLLPNPGLTQQAKTLLLRLGKK